MDFAHLPDDVSTALGGGPAAQAQEIKAQPVPGDDLDDLRTETAVAPESVGSQPGPHQNPLDDSSMEFVHFGRVHRASALKFQHGPDHPGRALLFRDALLRETILLHQAMSAVLFVLAELEQCRGGLGQVADVVGKLLGSGDSAPKSADLDAQRRKVTAIGATLNQAAITYPVLHKAGVDLQTARLTFNAFAQRVRQYHVDQLRSGSGGMLGSLPGAEQVAAAARIVEKLTFKPLHVSLAMCLEVYAEYSDSIDGACRSASLAFIKGFDSLKPRPSFPIWFTPPEGPNEHDTWLDRQLQEIDKQLKEAKTAHDDAMQSVAKAEAALKALRGSDGQSQTPAGADRLFDDVLKPVEQAKSRYDEWTDSWDNFWKVAVPAAPGDATLDEIFAALDGSSSGDGAAAPRKLGEVVAAAFNETVTPSPFFDKVLGALSAAVLRFLHMLFAHIDDLAAGYPLNEQGMVILARQHLLQAVIDLILGLVPNATAIGSDTNPSFGIEPFTFSGAQVRDRLGRLADDGVGKLTDGKLAEYAGMVLHIAIGHLVEHMEEGRRSAAGMGASTMEWFVGQLPVIAALMVRNLFFPIWDLVVCQLFGLGDKLAQIGLSPIESAIGRVKWIVDGARAARDDYEERFDNIKDALKQLSGVSANSLGELDQQAGEKGAQLGRIKDEVDGDASAKRTAERERAAKAKAELERTLAEAAARVAFPGATRIETGYGLTIDPEQVVKAEADWS